MDVIVILLPIALALGFLGLGAFMWSLRTRQYEDLEGAGWRILSDDDLPDPARPAQYPAKEEPRQTNGG
ncbi:MAG: cbb3-type cytochrome oxidase assembly protein CcoS [Beijerinckiaceae bacterium]